MNRLPALAATWLALGPEPLGGVRFDGQSVVYAFKVPVVPHAVTGATYTNISSDALHVARREERSLTTGRPGVSSWSLRPIAPRARTRFHPQAAGVVEGKANLSPPA